MSLAPWGNLVCDLYINDLEFSSPCQDAIMILEQQKWGGQILDLPPTRGMPTKVLVIKQGIETPRKLEDLNHLEASTYCPSSEPNGQVTPSTRNRGQRCAKANLWDCCWSAKGPQCHKWAGKTWHPFSLLPLFFCGIPVVWSVILWRHDYVLFHSTAMNKPIWHRGKTKKKTSSAAKRYMNIHEHH